MLKLKPRFEAILEDNDISFTYYDDEIELETDSNAGEDLLITLPIKNFVEEFKEYYTNFDPDEHAEEWAHYRYENPRNKSTIPPVSVLVDDARWIDKFLYKVKVELHDELLLQCDEYPDDDNEWYEYDEPENE